MTRCKGDEAKVFVETTINSGRAACGSPQLVIAAIEDVMLTSWDGTRARFDVTAAALVRQKEARGDLDAA